MATASSPSHPHDWHGWIDCGNGSIGNMGTHVFDALYQAMDMWKTAPSKVVVRDVTQIGVA